MRTNTHKSRGQRTAQVPEPFGERLDELTKADLLELLWDYAVRAVGEDAGYTAAYDDIVGIHETLRFNGCQGDRRLVATSGSHPSRRLFDDWEWCEEHGAYHRPHQALGRQPHAFEPLTGQPRYCKHCGFAETDAQGNQATPLHR